MFLLILKLGSTALFRLGYTGVKNTEMNTNSLKWGIRFSERNIEKLPWKVLLVVSYN